MGVSGAAGSDQKGVQPVADRLPRAPGQAGPLPGLHRNHFPGRRADQEDAVPLGHLLLHRVGQQDLQERTAGRSHVHLSVLSVKRSPELY